ncbi:MAG: pyridoxal phosphate-dependent aminotransferase, partial [Paracoccaceae bacterium]
RYSDRLGRTIGKDQLLCLPGTQSALFVALMSITDPGDEVIVGDPMYATYQGIIAASGAVRVPVKLRPEMGFRLQASDVAALITPRTRAIFLNSPHNPTGAMLTPEDIRALGDLAKKHDLWIISDEVYEDLVFPGQSFTSPYLFEDLVDRVIVACSISKSHAAAGFRSGWCMGTPETIARMLPVAETMLFGNQPFIADMTAAALSAPSPVAAGMVARFARRSEAVFQMLDGVAGLAVHRPQAGMFAVIDVRGTGLDSVSFAERLLESQHVAVMPGLSFGDTFGGWIRFSLSRPDADINEACARMARFSQSLREAAE